MMLPVFRLLVWFSFAVITLPAQTPAMSQATTPTNSAPAPIPPPLRLRDVRTVYVGTFGNGENAETIRAKVLAAIVKSGRITVALSEEDADALLTGTALTTSCCSDATLRLVARANHKILWADGASDGLRLTLSQEISATSNRIVKKLLAAIEKDKH